MSSHRTGRNEAYFFQPLVSSARRHSAPLFALAQQKSDSDARAVAKTVRLSHSSMGRVSTMAAARLATPTRRSTEEADTSAAQPRCLKSIPNALPKPSEATKKPSDPAYDLRRHLEWHSSGDVLNEPVSLAWGTSGNRSHLDGMYHV